MLIALSSDDIPIEPEVRVHSVRRRRSEPPKPLSPPPPNVRSWMIYAGLGLFVLALMVDGFLGHRPQRPALPSYSEATEVRSALTEVADSLQMVVSWELTLADSSGRPDSIRVKVVTGRRHPDSLISMQPSTQFADTFFFPAPRAGQSMRGVSCAAAEYSGQALEESCTPWQYVRPSVVAAQSPAKQAGPNQVIIKPSGLQVDPDVGGKCAEWQKRHPGESVWVTVNSQAVPDCTGPNRKPTVAQFCAFVVLPDGRRIKAANSANNRYCDGLFVLWTRERYS